MHSLYTTTTSSLTRAKHTTTNAKAVATLAALAAAAAAALYAYQRLLRPRRPLTIQPPQWTPSLWGQRFAHHHDVLKGFHKAMGTASRPMQFSVNPHLVIAERVVIVMVGLPARGKSYISHAIVRYLNFLGCPARLFNAGNKRRDHGLAGTRASFFDSGNAQAAAQRERLAMETLDELLSWLSSADDGAGKTPRRGCACGILDATNTTVERRQRVLERCRREEPIRVIFLESICEDESLLATNYRLKAFNDDYKDQPEEAALGDFLNRVHQYEKVYQTVTDAESANMRYLKIIDGGRQLMASRCEGYVLSKVLSLLHSIHLGPRIIWIALAGQTTNDAAGILGGDTALSHSGKEYSSAVCRLISEREVRSSSPEQQRSSSEPTTVMTGTLRRYEQFVDELVRHAPPSGRRTVLKLQRLNELCAGQLDSLSIGQMQTLFPHEYTARSTDKLHYRYPGVGGESYLDLVLRMSEVLLSIEQVRTNVLVVCDRAVARVLIAYFLEVEPEAIPYIDVGPGVMELKRSNSGFSSSHFHVDEGLATTAAGPGTTRMLSHGPQLGDNEVRISNPATRLNGAVQLKRRVSDSSIDSFASAGQPGSRVALERSDVARG